KGQKWAKKTKSGDDGCPKSLSLLLLFAFFVSSLNLKRGLRSNKFFILFVAEANIHPYGGSTRIYPPRSVASAKSVGNGDNWAERKVHPDGFFVTS
ncbi:MAG: hypothetical protein J2P31_00435, partial [Blastocatellia bacterium]|nr:hypothetical protein [Blastocatellia bacterium]